MAVGGRKKGINSTSGIRQTKTEATQDETRRHRMNTHTNTFLNLPIGASLFTTKIIWVRVFGSSG